MTQATGRPTPKIPFPANGPTLKNMLNRPNCVGIAYNRFAQASHFGRIGSGERSRKMAIAIEVP